MFNKKNIRIKKAFRRNCLHCFNSEKVLQEHWKKFKNYFKQIVVSFKIYADSEYNLEKLHINDREKNTSYTEKYQSHIPYSFAYKLACIDDKFNKPVILYRGKNVI